MQSILQAFRKRPLLSRSASIVVGFLIPYLYLMIANVTEAYCDAWVYVEHAKGFSQNGLLNLSAYAAQFGTSYRGYLLPWLIALGDVLAGLTPLVGYRFLISLFASISCTLALPAIIEHIFSVRFSHWKRPLLLLPLVFLFRGTLEYPLSDMWAAGCALLALWALVGFTTDGARPLHKRLLAAAGCGAALSAAYNIRTINLLLIISVSVAAIVMLLKRRKLSLWQRLLCLLCMGAGFLAVALPQMLINWQCYRSLSPLLISEDGSNLFINQLYDGIYTAKYETNVGYDYWLAEMPYLDRAGLAIFAQEGFDANGVFGTGAQYLTGIGDYLRLVFKYPLDFIGIYARHLVNLIDIRYPEIYVEHIQANALVPIVNYLLCYGGGAALCLELRQMKRDTMPRLWLFLVLLLPTVCILAGAIETRFSIVLMLALWGCLLGLFRRGLFAGLRARSCVALTVGLIGFLLAMSAVGGDTMAGFADWAMLY